MIPAAILSLVAAVLASAGDRPVYRHDSALTSISRGNGAITKPEVKWECYLGAPFVSIATDRKPVNAYSGDLDGDGLDEIVMAPFTIYAVLAGKTGEPIFPPIELRDPAYFGRWVGYFSPTVADLNSDGKPEIYLNSNSYARSIYAALALDGRILWHEFHDNTEGSGGFGPVGDFDGDGRAEIGIPVLNGTLLCLNGSDGSHKWRIKASVAGDAVAADVNGDGIMELLFSTTDGSIRAVSGKDGSDVWSIPVSGRPIVADVDGDGLVEVIAVGSDGVLRIIGQR